MKGIWAVFAVLCACAEAKQNNVNLGAVSVHAKVGNLKPCGPLTVVDEKAASNARVALEHLRHYFPTGLGYIPPLDPFRPTKPVFIHIKRSDFICSVLMSNIKVTGGQTFSLSDLEIRLKQSSWNFTMNFKKLAVSMDYQGECITDNAVMVIKPTHYNMTLADVRSKCAVRAEVVRILGPKNREELQAVALHFDATAKDVQYDLDSQHRPRRSVPASSLTRMVAEDLKNDVAVAIAENILFNFNEVVRNYDYKQIINLLSPQP